MKYSFREFMQLDEETRKQLGTIGTSEELSNNLKRKKMKELEQKLKSHDYYFVYSDDMRSYKKGQKEQDEINKLINLLGDEGVSLYKQFLKSKGMQEDKTKPRLNPYEKFLQQKMGAWNIKSLDDLEPEPLKRFWKEVDDEWVAEK